MKKMILLALFTLAGCVDITHYISFNDQGRTVSSMQISFSAALLESESDAENLKEKFMEMTNRSFTESISDTNIRVESQVVSNTAVFGVEERRTAPRHYFASKNQTFFPVKEPYGFSLYFDNYFKEGAEGFRGSGSEDAMIVAIMMKYRILLSKADLPRPLTKVVLSLAGKGKETIEAPIYDYGVMYMIEIPSTALIENKSKVEFHFADK